MDWHSVWKSSTVVPTNLPNTIDQPTFQYSTAMTATIPKGVLTTVLLMRDLEQLQWDVRLFCPRAELPTKLLNIVGVDQSCPQLLSLAGLAAFHPPPLNFTTVRDALTPLPASLAGGAYRNLVVGLAMWPSVKGGGMVDVDDAHLRYTSESQT
ncbi:hypothetical protein PGT21_016120 [Puccinia graminis f. sp. tritici]|uniref:Uncharacterized protein n=1 Tax=Puccinia graminis f. sp. tritici TaxID=56615 RepID=A0A5B0NLG2_PUCGR|nr:hypothetical protein PGT21_016120 [Puccinia graminis f. sp. tritici]